MSERIGGGRIASKDTGGVFREFSELVDETLFGLRRSKRKGREQKRGKKRRRNKWKFYVKVCAIVAGNSNYSFVFFLPSSSSATHTQRTKLKFSQFF